MVRGRTFHLGFFVLFCFLLINGPQTVSMKTQIANSLDFVGDTVSLTTTQLCHCRVKTVIDNKQMDGCYCVPIKHNFEQKVVNWIWPVAMVCWPPLYCNICYFYYGLIDWFRELPFFSVRMLTVPSVVFLTKWI